MDLINYLKENKKKIVNQNENKYEKILIQLIES